MRQLGYYAKDSSNNLFKFEWGNDDTFYVLKEGSMTKQNPKDYEIIEIGYFRSKEESTTTKTNIMEIEVYVFSNFQVRFTEQGAKELAQEYGYKDLEDSYEDGFHYYTEMTPEDIDNYIS